MPIHQLLVQNRVTAVFHGHDHAYAKQELDGITYQLVPQPGCPGEGSARQAANYGYEGGAILPGSGYLRLTVAPASASVCFMRTRAAGSSPSLAHQYVLPGQEGRRDVIRATFGGAEP
jgi:hypothetical protein